MPVLYVFEYILHVDKVSDILTIIMEAFVIVYAIGTAIVGGIYLWTFTKPGKKWLKNL